MIARRRASILALVIAVEATAGAAESVTERLRRQTQELVDAITTGSAAVWIATCTRTSASPMRSDATGMHCRDSRLDATRSPWRAEAPDVLFVPGKPRYRKVFLRGPDGRITGFAERREAWDIVWKRL